MRPCCHPWMCTVHVYHNSNRIAFIVLLRYVEHVIAPILARSQRSRANIGAEGQYQGQYEITHVIFYLFSDITPTPPPQCINYATRCVLQLSAHIYACTRTVRRLAFEKTVWKNYAVFRLEMATTPLFINGF